ncbi:MAG: hypothetical protein E6G77_05860 [Alphaproteobacteria bacterium]|nr:MAG: hypothetical protein E6G77_05860 [Alphaproteobacteria bacterium]
MSPPPGSVIFPPGRGLEKAIEGSGSGEAVLSVFRATNLLSSFEMIRIQDVLRGPDADTFIRAGARFTMGETKPALAAMERVLRRQG